VRIGALQLFTRIRARACLQGNPFEANLLLPRSLDREHPLYYLDAETLLVATYVF
jgi:hypothetical protein